MWSASTRTVAGIYMRNHSRCTRDPAPLRPSTLMVSLNINKFRNPVDYLRGKRALLKVPIPEFPLRFPFQTMSSQ